MYIPCYDKIELLYQDIWESNYEVIHTTYTYPLYDTLGINLEINKLKQDGCKVLSVYEHRFYWESLQGTYVTYYVEYIKFKEESFIRQHKTLIRTFINSFVTDKDTYIEKCKDNINELIKEENMKDWHMNNSSYRITDSKYAIVFNLLFERNIKEVF